MEIAETNLDMSIWLRYSSNDPFKKIFGNLRYTRNLVAHGQDVDDTVFQLVAEVGGVHCLYVYTVAKFLD